ncbi:MAG TPA: triose-phosphate isomerase [Dissulfurispiraceae bacterium]|nr:triose-phosphate isomerase [Dissulfurispiraceae bacterium]
MRRPLIAANWKMHKTAGETKDFIGEFLPLVRDARDVDIVIAPPFTSLPAASTLLKDTPVHLCAQDVFSEDKGAYTGEISPLMLTDLGCAFVIIGHSERRQYFHETDETVNRKIGASRRHGLRVILCIGELLEEREAGRTYDVLRRQLDGALFGTSLDGIVIAYEPVWAIGTGRTATTDQAQEAHRFIRGHLAGRYGDAAGKVLILYGGSVTPDNISSLMGCADVDGALVGGASLKADSFSRIVRFGT